MSQSVPAIAEPDRSLRVRSLLARRIAPAASTQLSDALDRERHLASERMNRLRLVAVGGYLGMLILFGHVLGDPMWQSGMAPTLAYFALALALFHLGRTRPSGGGGWTRAVVPLIDTPVTAWTIWSTAQTGSAAGAVGVGAAVFAFLILLVASTLDRRLIAIEAIAAGLCEAALQLAVGVSTGAILYTWVLLGSIAGACAYLTRRLELLVQHTVAAQVQRERLERYFSPSVAHEVQRTDLETGQTRAVTILISDIRGFTALCEQSAGPEMVAFLNEYLTRMVDVIFAFGGTLDKFMGDGILAYFGAPIDQTDHAHRAALCALAMQREVIALSQHAAAPPKLGLRVGIGVHSGVAIVGAIGSPRRREYTVIGDAVNVAARIENLTKELGRPILISESTRLLLPEDFSALPMKTVQLRGKREQMQVFALDAS